MTSISDKNARASINLVDRLPPLPKTKRARFLAIVLLLAPLIVFTKWFDAFHGTFTYDDLDFLGVARTSPLIRSLLDIHGDVPLPLTRVFFSSMYALFGTTEAYWNLYYVILVLAVQLTALAILVSLGSNFVVASCFFLTAISASVWNYTAAGYYSLSIYVQIGLLGLIGIFAIIRWRSGDSEIYKWIAVGVSAAAPFIHPSGAYVPLAVGTFAFVSQLGLPDGSFSPLRMFRPDFRALTISLATIVVVFAMFFAFEMRNQQFLSMAQTPPSASAVLKSMYFLFSQGMALELLKPLIGPALKYSGADKQGFVAVAITLLFFANAVAIPVRQRWTFLGLLAISLIIVVVVSFGRRLASIDAVVGAGGKYSNFAFLWFTLSVFYLVACLAAKTPLRWRRTGGAAVISVACILFLAGVRGENRYAIGAMHRKEQMREVLGPFADYAAKTAPAAMHIPTLDGNFIFPQHTTLWKYNLAHYRVFFHGFDDRLTLLRNSSMETWGSEATETVPSLRQATDPEFVQALQTNRDLQSLYLTGVELISLPQPIPGGEPVSPNSIKISNATSIVKSAESISFTSRGLASAILLSRDWDPEDIHIFTIRIDAVYERPRSDTKIQVVFDGQLPIPYLANTIVLPAEGGEISFDLLQLYSYSLNPRVSNVTLRFPSDGSYTISRVRIVR